jgi:hypothetical protein
MNPGRNILFVSIIMFALASCGKKGTPNPTSNKKTQTIVYVAGNIKAAGNISVAVYWRNGVKIALADSSTGLTISAATGIAVNDTDVYICGAVNAVATYWKNGKAVSLPGVGGYANAITVSGTDVYVAGTANNLPTLWKNGIAVTLDAGGGTAIADGIAVVGGNVYVAGNSLPTGIVYWKNGVLTPIANSPSTAGTFYQNTYDQGWVNIGVSGTDVYITGSAPAHLTATYWKNGTAVPLVSDPTVTSVLNNIAINGTDVYTVGYEGLSAAYWKNGTLNTLSGSTQSFYMASAIAINGSDVYIAGFGGPSNPQAG